MLSGVCFEVMVHKQVLMNKGSAAPNFVNKLVNVCFKLFMKKQFGFTAKKRSRIGVTVNPLRG